MPSLLESVTTLLGEDDAYDELGELIGGDDDQAAEASRLAIPAILGGLAEKSSDDGGLETVMALLESADGSVLDDLDDFLERGQAEAGNEILDRVLGAGRVGLISRLASKAGMSRSTLGKLLPMLAPVIVAELARRRTEEELDGAGVAQLLAAEKEQLEREGLLAAGDDVGSAGATAAAGAAAVAGTGAGVAAATKDRVGARAGAIGELVDRAKGGADLFGDAAEAMGDLADKVGDAAERVTDAAEDGLEEAAEAVVGGVDVVKEKAAGAIGAVTGARPRDEAGGPAGGSATSVAAGPPGDGRPGTGLGWLWWAVGAVVLVLLLAWLLSTCNDEADEVDAGATTVVDVDATAGDTEVDAGDTGSDSTTGDGTDPADGDLQDRVDEALAGTAVTGTAAGGVVTLTGTVEDEGTRADVIATVEALAGVASVDDRLEVDGSGDGEASAGTTINELLDLEPVTFSISSATITADGRAVLDQAATYLLANPDIRVEIGGHTDDDGSEQENLDLSTRRAEAVKSYLEALGVDPTRMETRGYGEAEPKVPNTTSAGKAVNRRIEFTIL